MKKTVKRAVSSSCFEGLELRFDSNVENFKRRRALPRQCFLDTRTQLFFERMLNVKRIRDFVFLKDGLFKDSVL